MPQLQSAPQPIASDQTGDEELVARAIAGDAHAFEQIMRRYNRLLFRSARSILRNDDDAQDVLQEGYLRAWRSLRNFRGDARLSTWLVRIVINEALGRLRRHGAQVIPLDTVMDSQEPRMHTEHAQQPEAQAMRAQVRGLVEARIDELPDAFRTVFMLRAVEEMSCEEVAQVLGIPEATVRTRFFRARGLLREGLSRDFDHAIDDAFAFAGERCDCIVTHVLARLAEAREADPS